MKAIRTVALLLVLVGAGLLVSYWFSNRPEHDFGQVFVRAGGFDYSASLPAAVLALVVALLLLWLLWSVAALPFRAWSRRRSKLSRARLVEGLHALHGGQWARAEKSLTPALDDPEVGTIARVAAARASEARGDDAAVQAHLAALAVRDPVSHALLAAERALSRHQPVDAINALDVAAAQPLPPRGSLLRAEALADIGRCSEAYGLLGALRNQQVLPAEALAALEIRLSTGTLHEAPDANALAARWEDVPKALRSHPEIVAAYSARGAELGWDEAALGSLAQAIDRDWDDALAVLYGLLPVGRLEARRAVAERWLQAHPDSPGLLLTLGRLARQQGDWGRAQAWLDGAIANGAGAAAWEELAEGLAANGAESAARVGYANALRMGRGEPALEMPRLDDPFEDEFSR